MKNLKRIITLTFISTTLVILLFGFITINYDNLKQLTNAEGMSLGCGTTSYQKKNRELVLTEEAMNGQALFNMNCKSCHRLNQRLVGPALAGIFNRRDSAWIRKMIVNADKLILSGNE